MNWTTITFRETVVSGETPGSSAVIVAVQVETDGETRNAGSLVMGLEEWDRVWRSLVQAVPAFDRNQVALHRIHAPGRI